VITTASAHRHAGPLATHPMPLRATPPLPDRRRSLGRLAGAGVIALERVYCMAAVLLLSGALVPLLMRDTVSATELNEGHPLIRALFTGVYATMLLFAVVRWRSFLRVAVRDGATLLLVALAIVSVVWSLDPELSLRRGVALTLTTAFGWYLAARWSMLELLRLLAYGLGAALVLSVVFVLAIPELGVHGGIHEGAWRGAFVHKNLLGKFAALAALLFAILWRSEDQRRWPAAAGLMLAVGLVLLSRSITAVVTLAALLGMLPIVSVLRWRFSRRAPLLAGATFVAGAAALLLAANLDAALLAMGRDATLTGRTALWAAVAEAGMQRPWLGAGYSAFWATVNPGVALVQESAGWRAQGSHNGMMDLWLDLGFVGLALFLAAVALGTRRSFRALRSTARPETAWPLLVIAFVLLTNLTEGGLLRQNNLVWVVFVAAVAIAIRVRRTPGRAGGSHG
jgi:exopolysaccharide production protein ExoQ